MDYIYFITNDVNSNVCVTRSTDDTSMSLEKYSQAVSIDMNSLMKFYEVFENQRKC